MAKDSCVELRDPDVYPDEAALRAVLGKNFAPYQALLGLFADAGVTVEWRYYRDGNAWLCKAQKKKKTLFWLSVQRDHVVAVSYLPETSMGEVYALEISDAAKARFREVNQVGKSRPCAFDITDAAVLSDLAVVMAYKAARK
jgi:hypothetical protein